MKNTKNTVTHKILRNHLVKGELEQGKEIEIKIDQTLTQDATGTLVMLELEELELQKAKTEVSVQYVDHNLLAVDNKNPDDHLFLSSAANKFGLWFSPPGNGISHVIHMENFGRPGKTLIGSDSHSCAAGSMGMLAIGIGGLDVALAIYGEPLRIKMPEVIGVKLSGKLRKGVSAKDVILEMLRRFDVKGGKGKIYEYFGEGVNTLEAMDRHVIANMGAELGATTSVFPSDNITKSFLKLHDREDQWIELKNENESDYDSIVEINLSEVEPLIAKPCSPGNVVAVKDVVGTPIYQSYIGSSANPGYRDFEVVANIMKGQDVAKNVSLDINPSSRETLTNLTKNGKLHHLLSAGARIHQSGCNGCIGMGQAPATDENSLRTTPRNFPGRSGTKEDKVWLCSPETAAFSALAGEIRNPLDENLEFEEPIHITKWETKKSLLVAPLEEKIAKTITLKKGPNIGTFPTIEKPKSSYKLTTLLKVGDNISTDEILPAGSKVLPYRSNIKKISEFVYNNLDIDYFKKANEVKEHCLVGGENYGQGSSREHAVLAPVFLGLKFILAKSFSRIYRSNMVNYGVIPMIFENPEDYEKCEMGQKIYINDTLNFLENGTATVEANGKKIKIKHDLSPREVEVINSGGIINYVKAKNN